MNEPDPAPTQGELAGVSLTALGVAGIRAHESLRADRLFDDPLAAAFVAVGGLPRSGTGSDGEYDEAGLQAIVALMTSVVTRTPYIDEHVLDAARTGCRQVVILGAGLDTRAFRLAWPEGTRLFELDTAEVLGFKDRVLEPLNPAPACERSTLAVDLREDWPAALREAGLRAGEPIAWIAEGLLIYLEPEDVERLMGRIGELSPPGSRLVVSGNARSLVERWQARTEAQPGRELVGMWRSGIEGDPVAWLAGHGWEATATDTRENAAALGRPFPPAREDRPSGWLIDARR